MIRISQNPQTQMSVDSKSSNEKNELLLHTTVWINLKKKKKTNIKWKKTEIKEYIGFGSIYIKFKGKQTSVW